jgi:hypothetical protein
MNRGGALTLGAVLMLGGLTGARGEDISGAADGTPTAAILPSWGGVFPRLPQNWSDLPVQLKLWDSVGYNSNVLGLPTNTPVSSGLVRGDFQSISSYGASTKAYWEGQQLFADGSFGLTRYLHDVSLNSMQHFLDAGVNWTYTSRCSGRLGASDSVAESTLPQQIASGSAAAFTLAQQIASGSIAAPSLAQQTASGTTAASPVPQQIASTSINTVSTTAFNETAKCLVSGDYAAIFNSGLTRSTNSTLANKPNDGRIVVVAAGISYSVTATNSLDVLATVTSTDYTNRTRATNNTGLVNAITQDQVNVTYTRQIGPNLSMIASIGAVGLTNGSFSLALPSKIEPQYSASVIWAVTPKVSLTASVARTVTPPQSIVANAQTTESASLGLNYRFSPKVAFSANVSSAYASSAFTQLGSGVPNGVPAYALSALHSYNATASLGYNITPFLGANLSYLYSRSVQAGVVTPQNLVLLNVNYSPY